MQTHLSSRRRGFTILELLVTITLIGVISLMAFGRTSAMMTQWRVGRAAQAYAEELQSAFAIVGRDRKPVRIVLAITNTSTLKKVELQITNRDQTVIYRKRSLGPASAYKLDPTDISASSTDLLIFPPGLAADTLTVTFRRQGKFRRVRLLRGGLVQVCSNPSTVNGPCTPA
jgi:prepilin-type N-terminal cleavage/methylation domain-containing protein